MVGEGVCAACVWVVWVVEEEEVLATADMVIGCCFGVGWVGGWVGGWEGMDIFLSSFLVVCGWVGGWVSLPVSPPVFLWRRRKGPRRPVFGGRQGRKRARHRPVEVIGWGRVGWWVDGRRTRQLEHGMERWVGRWVVGRTKRPRSKAAAPTPRPRRRRAGTAGEREEEGGHEASHAVGVA